ncbi:EAL domain-containing protein [Curvibacter lanceolatus]|uniref:EAL domain-containing protein n=1 Tax=Curvibacter lanceolatus TaxID=86182 RepID=UPI00037B23A8|nr:EAL domain-containing protein [Curvibacter lanceolatus]
MATALYELLQQPLSGLLRLLPPDTPLLCLQGAALVGLLAAVLLVCRRHGLPLRQRSLALGLAVGSAGYVIGAMVSNYGESEVRPTLVIDFLYLGAYLGGWRGGLLSFAMVELARWQYGGIMHLGAALADGSIHVLCGWVLRLLIDPRALLHLQAHTVLWVWAGRLLSTALGAWVGMVLSDTPFETLVLLWQGRAAVLPISLLVIYCTLLLLATDAQIDAQQAREHALLRRDPVSGLANRRALSECVQAHWRLEPSRAACLVVVELGNLSDFLSRHGHERAWQLWKSGGLEQGGALLREVLAALRDYRPTPFQYSDFSLALFLEGVALAELEDRGELEAALRRCEVGLSRAWPGYRAAVRCAVVDLAPAHEAPAPHLPYREITLALNSLPRGVAYFNSLMRQDQALDAFIESQINRWADPRTVPIWLQPKLHLANGQVGGAEALLRLNEPEGRSVSPMRVITVARRCGRLAEVEWATVAATAHLLQGLANRLPGVSMAVNVSAESLRIPGFAQQVQALLAQCRVPSALLRLELVEWSDLVDDPLVQANLAQLTALGVPLSIDDFGTGYSNLLLLTRFSFSEVKIDRSLVISLGELKSLVVVQHIVELAHRCGATVVAEGVETTAMATQVRDLGVDMGQGYLFSRALPPEEFLAYCRRPRLVLPV